MRKTITKYVIFPKTLNRQYFRGENSGMNRQFRVKLTEIVPSNTSPLERIESIGFVFPIVPGLLQGFLAVCIIGKVL